MPHASDHNAVTLPGDKAEATRMLFQRLVKLAADKRALADHVRDKLKDAKNDHKIPPDQIRLAAKLQQMTPEKRERWAQRISAAALMFGYSPLGVADEADTKTPVWSVLEAVKPLASMRADARDEERQLIAAAKARGDIDVAAIRFLVRFAKVDPDERADWFASVDTLATFLELW